MKMSKQALIDTILASDSGELNEMIRLIKQRRTTLAQMATNTVEVGDSVTFDAGRRGIITGTVLKINTKTVQVKQTNGLGITWKVSANLLKKV